MSGPVTSERDLLPCKSWSAPTMMMLSASDGILRVHAHSLIPVDVIEQVVGTNQVRAGQVVRPLLEGHDLAFLQGRLKREKRFCNLGDLPLVLPRGVPDWMHVPM